MTQMFSFECLGKRSCSRDRKHIKKSTPFLPELEMSVRHEFGLFNGQCCRATEIRVQKGGRGNEGLRESGHWEVIGPLGGWIRLLGGNAQ